MQLFIVIIILVLAVCYIAYRTYKALTQKKGDACYGCPIKDACEKQKKENKGECPPSKST